MGRGELAAVVGGLVDLGGAASPSSIALARTTSCSAVRSGTLPISLRYMRTGSLVGALRASSSSRAERASRANSSALELVDHLDDLDVLVLQVLQDVVHLLGRRRPGRGPRCLLVGEEAPLLALGDEVSDLVDLRLFGDGDLLRDLSFRTAPGGSAAYRPRRCAGGDPRRLWPRLPQASPSRLEGDELFEVEVYSAAAPPGSYAARSP